MERVYFILQLVVHHDRKLGRAKSRDLEAGTEKEAMEVLLACSHGLLNLFLMLFKSMCLGEHHPWWAGSSSLKYQSRKPCRFAYSKSDGGIFSIVVLSV